MEMPRRLVGSAARLLTVLAAAPAWAVSSGDAGRIDVNVNALLGADAFYGAGYDGSGAVVGLVESGHVWNGHQTLRRVDTFIQSPQNRFANTQLGDFNRHATFVAGVLGGKQDGDAANYKTGIAPGAALWSGAIATQWFDTPSNADSFGFADRHALVYPFLKLMRDGVGGRTADVINFSVGLGSGDSAADVSSRFIDGLVNDHGQTVVVSAGNTGPAQGTVNRPADAYNVIAVGALARGTATPYANVASFSSRGAGDFFNPVTGRTVPDVRALVDLVAPGHDLIAPFYGGATGQNTGGTDITAGRADRYAGYNPPGPNTGGPVSGTSFSAPVVSGVAALLVDAGRDRFGGGAATDGRTIKAVLLNSASKPGVWDNGQATGGDGVARTTQALDFTFGAGRLDAGAAYRQFTAGTADLPGESGGVVDAIGWDAASATQGVATEYLLGELLAGGSRFTATLTWFADRHFDALAFDGATTIRDNSLDNLDLQLWSVGDLGDPLALVAESVSPYNTVEHFSVLLPGQGRYMLRVLWAGEWYDRGNDVNAERFAIAWSGVAVPEPAALAILLVGAALGATRRRR